MGCGVVVEAADYEDHAGLMLRGWVWGWSLFSAQALMVSVMGPLVLW